MRKENCYYRIYSLNAKDMANFYAEVFCSEKPELLEYCGSFYYRCNLPFCYTLDIFHSNLKLKVKELRFEVSSTEYVSRKLINYGVEFYHVNNRRILLSEDIDGNKLYIEGTANFACMPKVAYGL